MEKNKGGRPKKHIDKELFERLCSHFNTKGDMCHILNVDEKTITRWCNDTYGCSFSEAYSIYSASGKMSIRRAMFDLATKKLNFNALRWLHEQHLGERQPTNIEEASEEFKIQLIDDIKKGVKDAD